MSAITVTLTFVETMVLVSIALRTPGEEAWKLTRAVKHYDVIRSLLEKIFCVPASSAPVERVFSCSGIIVRPHCARIGDDLLSALVYLKCNGHIWFAWDASFWYRKTEDTNWTETNKMTFDFKLKLINVAVKKLCSGLRLGTTNYSLYYFLVVSLGLDLGCLSLDYITGFVECSFRNKPIFFWNRFIW